MGQGTGAVHAAESKYLLNGRLVLVCACQKVQTLQSEGSLQSRACRNRASWSDGACELHLLLPSPALRNREQSLVEIRLAGESGAA